MCTIRTLSPAPAECPHPLKKFRFLLSLSLSLSLSLIYSSPPLPPPSLADCFPSEGAHYSPRRAGRIERTAPILTARTSPRAGRIELRGVRARVRACVRALLCPLFRVQQRASARLRVWVGRGPLPDGAKGGEGGRRTPSPPLHWTADRRRERARERERERERGQLPQANWRGDTRLFFGIYTDPFRRCSSPPTAHISNGRLSIV